MRQNNDIWLDIVEYAAYQKKSISTVRRYVKSEKVRSKFENGKFYILVVDDQPYKRESVLEEKILQAQKENETLRKKLNKIEEERRDLEMLVQIYENKNIQPPDVPADS